ncbi:MAG TPA: hypothetical protein PKD05_05515 [Candidatus Melainabacteria bacterium]|nr:hypothetical protein [Candidatus Melainabacteria bacterium]
MAERRSDLKKNGGVGNMLAAVYEKFVLLMAIFSACFFGAFIIDAFTGDMRHGPGTQAACIIMFGGIFAACVFYLRSRWRDKGAVAELQQEQLILNLAKSNQGEVTVAEVSVDCGLSISVTKKAFERLAMTGVCQVDVSDQGELVYRFPSFEPEPESDMAGISSKGKPASNLGQSTMLFDNPDADEAEDVKISLKRLEKELEAEGNQG